MDILQVCLEEIALEGLDGVSLERFWALLAERRPAINFKIDEFSKRYIWKLLTDSPYVSFFNADIHVSQKEQSPSGKIDDDAKLPPYWIYNSDTDEMGYSPSYHNREDVTHNVKGGGKAMTIMEVEERWGHRFRMVGCQSLRQRILYGPSNPPIIEEVVPCRFVILELIGKTRWTGFLQADFARLYHQDPRTSFHHIKVLMRLHLVTKQNITVRPPVSADDPRNTLPPKSTKVLHIPHFSNVVSNDIQKYAAQICEILAQAPDEIMERTELKNQCSDIVQFKKIRQWLFHAGYIQYIINGEVWNSSNVTSMQTAHFRASRPCYVNLVKKFLVADVDDEKDDDFPDYIENCEDIEPQLIYEQPLLHQAYKVVKACREHGITMKKLAEVMCIAYPIARSIVRYFDTHKIGRMVTVDHHKSKVQKIIAIQFLHECDTVQQIKSAKKSLEKHKAFFDMKGNAQLDPKSEQDADPSLSDDSVLPAPCSWSDDTSNANDSVSQMNALKEKNLQLADQVDLTRVSEKNKVSLRHLARKNYVLEQLKSRPVYEGVSELYRGLILSEENVKSSHGLCCRKTFKRILNELREEGQLKILSAVVDNTCQPPLSASYYCSVDITRNSPQFQAALDSTIGRHRNLEAKREMRKLALLQDPNVPKEKGKRALLVKAEAESKDSMDTDDENFVPAKFGHHHPRYARFGRYQKLHCFHLYLWQMVYGSQTDIDDLVASSGSNEAESFVDLVSSRHIWLSRLSKLPQYNEGPGWFCIGDVISNMPLVLYSFVLGLKCESATTSKFLDDPVSRLVVLNNLPPRLKFKLLHSNANKAHVDRCVELLVFLAQMGLVAVSPDHYPMVRTEIMLYLRKEAKIVDTRNSQTTYCLVQPPEGTDSFPEKAYAFRSLEDVEKYWIDLQFVCLNTPLGLNRSLRPKKPTESDSASQEEKLGLRRIYRSFTILRDFQQYYDGKDLNNLEPVLFGNGLGAGGLDSTFFAHLAKNWRYGKGKSRKGARRSKSNARLAGKSKRHQDDMPKKIMVPTTALKRKRGGKGLKRLLANTAAMITRKVKMERKKQFDKLIAKRFEEVREKVRLKEVRIRAVRSRKLLKPAYYDETDREALRKMKGQRVTFSDREDAYVLFGYVVHTMMRLQEPGQPLEKDHPQIMWKHIRDIIHSQVSESRDKTWKAVARRARYIRKYSQSLIVYKTCVAELRLNKDFMSLISNCTIDNWKDKVQKAFQMTQTIYSKHFNPELDCAAFPTSMEDLGRSFSLEFAYYLADDSVDPILPQCERDVRVLVLLDLIHNAMNGQRSSSYIPALAFRIFDAFPADELNQAFEHYKKNKLICRLRFDIPRKRSLPISTMTYHLSATYYRLFEPAIPLTVFSEAKAAFDELRSVDRYSDGETAEESFELNVASLQGGHVAYLLAALANDELMCEFALPDEVTLCDETHMKRLQDGFPVFQRVAFEQRVRRGEEIVRKKIIRNPANKDTRQEVGQGPVFLQDSGAKETTLPCASKVVHIDSPVSCGDSRNSSLCSAAPLTGSCLSAASNSMEANVSSSSETGDQVSKQRLSLKRRFSKRSLGLFGLAAKRPNRELGPDESDAKYLALDADTNRDLAFTHENGHDALNPCTDTASLGHHIHDGANCDSEEAACGGIKNVTACTDSVSDGCLSSSTPIGRRKQLLADCASTEPANVLLRSSSKIPITSCRFDRRPLHSGTAGILLEEISADGFSCNFSSLLGPVSVSEAKARGLFSSGKRKIFDFCDASRSSKKLKSHSAVSFALNLKDVGLHASRTSLMMHRSFSTSKLVPTNALNTHEALIVNPMAFSFGFRATPFRQFVIQAEAIGDGPDLRLNEEEQAMCQRMRHMTENHNPYRDALSPSAFKDILISNLGLSEEIVRAHLLIIKIVEEAGPVGIALSLVKDAFISRFASFAGDFYEIVQTIINFRMLFRVGWQVTQLVSPQHVHAWSFIPPQLFAGSIGQPGSQTNVCVDPAKKKPVHAEDPPGDLSGITGKEPSALLAGGMSADGSGQCNTDGLVTDGYCESSVDMAKGISLEADKATYYTQWFSDAADERSISDEVRNAQNLSCVYAVADHASPSLSVNPTLISSSKNPSKAARKKPICSSGNVVKCEPWLKLNGDLNGPVLKRFQEVVLTYIMLNPGTHERKIIKNFELVLRPESVRSVLQFLVITGVVTKHYMQVRKPSLFSEFSDVLGEDFSDLEVYYLPRKNSLLNLMDLRK